jgi:translocator protein
MPTMPVFAAAGVAYYAAMGIVLSRVLRRRDGPAVAATIATLIGNELWNVAFFVRRSPRSGFFGIIVFGFAVGVLRRRVCNDPVSRRLVDAYLLWLVYDAWWTFRLWRLNPSRLDGKCGLR